MIRWIGLTALALVAMVPAAARAQYYVAPAPAPVVSYYMLRPRSATTAPRPCPTTPPPRCRITRPPRWCRTTVPAVSYYAAPSYYAPTTVSTYHYGLFGRRSVTTVGYGAPAYVAPAPVFRSYYSAPVYRSYYVYP